jgi:probable rRNA maturation factor
MKFHIIFLGSARAGVSKPWLEKHALKVWREILRVERKTAPRPKTKSVRHNVKFKFNSTTLIFVSSAEMKKLNKRYRGKNYATDVLSFAPTEPGSLGELVFCVDVLKRQAREHDLAYRDELSYMLIHGLLHLLGYDHEKSERAAREMFAVQDLVFERVRG